MATLLQGTTGRCWRVVILLASLVALWGCEEGDPPLQTNEIQFNVVARPEQVAGAIGSTLSFNISTETWDGRDIHNENWNSDDELRVVVHVADVPEAPIVQAEPIVERVEGLRGVQSGMWFEGPGDSTYYAGIQYEYLPRLGADVGRITSTCEYEVEDASYTITASLYDAEQFRNNPDVDAIVVVQTQVEVVCRPPTDEGCSNGVDDDGDSLTDCQDEDCADDSVCENDCGNDVVELDEECDGSDLAGETCESQGYGSGELRCTDECAFDHSDCETAGVCDEVDLTSPGYLDRYNGYTWTDPSEFCTALDDELDDHCTQGSSEEHGCLPGSGDHMELSAIGSTTASLEAETARALQELIDSYQISDSAVVHQGTAPVVRQGENHVLLMELAGDVPLAGSQYCQYSFVFDSDGDSANDWVPLPQYPYDFFQQTDRWYVADYTPPGHWYLNVSTVSSGDAQSVASDAVVIVHDATVMMVVPISEFDVPNPFVRYVAFCHDGSWGMNGGFWGGDLEPPIDAGLEDCCGEVLCGNGTIDDGEACDDGNDDDGDGCLSDCSILRCGDGVVAGSESCDDGNEADGDGCSSRCAYELAEPDALVTILGSIDSTDFVTARPGAPCHPNTGSYHYDVYVFENNSPDERIVDVRSDWSADGYLTVYHDYFNPAEATDNCVDGNDDYGSVTSSFVGSVTVPADDRLVVLASTYAPMSTIDAYTITVSTH